MHCRCRCRDISIEDLYKIEEGMSLILDKATPYFLCLSIVGMFGFGLLLLFENEPDLTSKVGLVMAVFLFIFSLIWLIFR